jgi:hypothetical protein
VLLLLVFISCPSLSILIGFLGHSLEIVSYGCTLCAERGWCCSVCINMYPWWYPRGNKGRWGPLWYLLGVMWGPKWNLLEFECSTRAWQLPAEEPL